MADGGCYSLATCEQPKSAAGCDAFDNKIGSLQNCCCLNSNPGSLPTCSGIDVSKATCDQSLHPGDSHGYKLPYCHAGNLDEGTYTTRDQCCCEEAAHEHKHPRTHSPSFKQRSNCNDFHFSGTEDCEAVAPPQPGMAPTAWGTFDPKTCKVGAPDRFFDYSQQACCERYLLGLSDDVKGSDPRADVCGSASGRRHHKPTVLPPSSELQPKPTPSPQAATPTAPRPSPQPLTPTAPQPAPQPLTPMKLQPSPQATKGAGKGGSDGGRGKGGERGSNQGGQKEQARPRSPPQSRAPMQRVTPHLPENPFHEPSTSHAGRAGRFAEYYLRD